LSSDALRDINTKMLNFNTKMAVTVKKISLALYKKFNVTRSTVGVESFILVSKSAHKVSFLALCRSATRLNQLNA